MQLIVLAFIVFLIVNSYIYYSKYEMRTKVFATPRDWYKSLKAAVSGEILQSLSLILSADLWIYFHCLSPLRNDCILVLVQAEYDFSLQIQIRKTIHSVKQYLNVTPRLLSHPNPFFFLWKTSPHKMIRLPNWWQIDFLVISTFFLTNRLVTFFENKGL